MVSVKCFYCISDHLLATPEFSQSSTRHLQYHVASVEQANDIILDHGVPLVWSTMLTSGQSCVVDHGGDDQVDVDPEDVGEAGGQEGQESEHIAHGDTTSKT